MLGFGSLSIRAICELLFPTVTISGSCYVSDAPGALIAIRSQSPCAIADGLGATAGITERSGATINDAQGFKAKVRDKI